MDREWTVDALGQMPLLKIYTQLCSIYPMPATASPEAITATLDRGLARLAASFPWTAGQIVTDGASASDSGTIKMKPLPAPPRVVARDLRADPSAPTLAALQQTRFPMRLLGEEMLCPRHTLPAGPGEAPTDPAPVFLVQATFLRGGLALAFVASHIATDVTGMGALIVLFDKACRGDDAPFAPDELDWGNRDRASVVPLLDPSWTLGRELDGQIGPPPAAAGPDGVPAPPEPPKCTWTYFELSAAALDALKAQATATKPAAAGFVSTDDALTALVWQAVSRVRQPRLGPDAETALLVRAVDARRYLGVPDAYPGILQNVTYHPTDLAALRATPLGALAAELRAAVDPAAGNVAHRTRALATYLARTPDRAGVSFTTTLDPGRGLAFSSWAKVGLYGLDFGLGLGRPEAVRRPRFAPFEGLVYALPRAPDGSMPLAVGLRDEDLAQLVADEEFARFATHIG